MSKFETSLVISVASNVLISSYILYKLWKVRSGKADSNVPTIKVLMFPDGGYQCNYWTAGGERIGTLLISWTFHDLPYFS